MRVLLAANPRSGGETDPDAIAERLTALGAIAERCELDELDAERVADARAERVVVAGGDGSIGLAAACAAAAGVPLAVIATGTANDFARAAGLSLELDDACALAVDPQARTRPFELARMEGRPFLNVATAGLSVGAAEAADSLKDRFGALAYGLGALRAGIEADPIDVLVEVDGEEIFDGLAWQVAVAATGHFGGGSSVGGTDSQDGLLDVVIVADDKKAALVKRAVAMRAGRLAEQEGVLTARGATVEIRGPEGFNVDGELCGCGAALTTRFQTDAAHVDVVVGS